MSAQQADLLAFRIASVFSGVQAFPPGDGNPGSRTTRSWMLDPGTNWANPSVEVAFLSGPNFTAQDVGLQLYVNGIDATPSVQTFTRTIAAVLGPSTVNLTVAPPGTPADPFSSGVGAIIGNTPPTFRMAPVTPTGLKTTGFLIYLKAPLLGTLPAATGPFSVTIWVRNPVDFTWAAGESVTMDYNEAFVTGDIDAADLYVQIEGAAVDGFIDVYFAEQ